MLNHRWLLTVAFMFLCCACSANAQNNSVPSTPEQRKQAVKMITFLETDPLAKESKEYRRTLTFFLIQVPDITIKLCNNVLGESKRLKGDYETDVVGHLMFSQAKFIIENPDKANDDAAVYLAGVEGVLRVWQAIKTAKPKAKFPLMEELLEKQQAGTLAEHVQAGMKGCKK